MSKKVTETPAAEGTPTPPAAPVSSTVAAVAKYEQGRAILLDLQRSEMGHQGISSIVLAAAAKLAKVRPGAA